MSRSGLVRRREQKKQLRADWRELSSVRDTLMTPDDSRGGREEPGRLRRYRLAAALRRGWQAKLILPWLTLSVLGNLVRQWQTDEARKSRRSRSADHATQAGAGTRLGSMRDRTRIEQERGCSVQFKTSVRVAGNGRRP